MTCNGTLNGRTLNPSQFNPIRCTTLLVLLSLPHAVNCARFCFWCHLSVVFCLCMKCLGEPLNGFTSYSHRRLVWSLAQTSFKVKVKGQDHQGQKTTFFTPFGGLRAFYVS